MAPQKIKVSMAGVAEGKELIGVPTGDDVSAEDRVKALLTGSMSEEIYHVSFAHCYFAVACPVTLSLTLIPLPSTLGKVSFASCLCITRKFGSIQGVLTPLPNLPLILYS